jgi:hypothetical protein
MSPAKRHAANAAVRSFAILGTDSITIDGNAVDFVVGEESIAKDFLGAGYDAKKNFTAVCMLAGFPIADPMKKLAVFNGGKYRVEGVRKKEPFLILILEEVTKG